MPKLKASPVDLFTNPRFPMILIISYHPSLSLKACPQPPKGEKASKGSPGKYLYGNLHFTLSGKEAEV